jgi:hypothetical protein
MKKIFSAVIHIIAAELLSTNIGLVMLGWICRNLLRRRIDTAILFYPANKRYMESVSYAWFAKRVQWTPCFGGIFIHKNAIGLIFAIGAYERNFAEVGNVNKLLKVHERMLKIGQLCGAQTVAYSGVLPGTLANIGVQREPIEIGWTAHWVVEALSKLSERMKYSGDVPVVIIGSAGFLGSKVVDVLKNKNGNQRLVLEIDPHHPDPSCRNAEALKRLSGQDVIFLNISRRHVIDEYIDHLWSGVAILNEVYPECSDEVLQQLKSKGVRYFHLQGVRAWSIPRFPGAYAGAIPCCAASAAEQPSAHAGDVELLILEK